MKDCKLRCKVYFMYFEVLHLTAAAFRYIQYILNFVHTLNLYSLIKSVIYFFCIPYIFYLVSSLF